MSDILKKAISLGLGLTAVSKDKVQQFVDEMVVKGELGKNEARDTVNELIARGEQHQSEIRRIVQEQVRKILADLDIATKQDLRDLELKFDAAYRPPVRTEPPKTEPDLMPSEPEGTQPPQPPSF